MRESGPEDCLLVVRRAPGTVGILRDLGVLVDGKRQARLAEGASARIAVAPGSHSLQVKMDWTTSPSVCVAAVSGESYEFICRCAVPPARLFFHPRSALELQSAGQPLPERVGWLREIGMRAVGFLVGGSVLWFLTLVFAGSAGASPTVVGATAAGAVVVWAVIVTLAPIPGFLVRRSARDRPH